MPTLRRLTVLALAAAATAGCGAALHEGGAGPARVAEQPVTGYIICRDGIASQYHPHATRLPTLGPQLSTAGGGSQLDLHRLPNGDLTGRCLD